MANQHNCPSCGELTTGYERGTERLAGRKYPGHKAKMRPCGCVVEFGDLPDPYLAAPDEEEPRV